MTKPSVKRMSAHPVIEQQSAAQLAPIGVAEYQLVRTRPAQLDTSLPSIEEIEAELSRSLGQEEGEAE